jgi:hypothetical protein
MEINASMLDTANRCYGEILQLTPRAAELMARQESLAALRKEYAGARFVAVRDVLPPDSFTTLVTTLLPLFSAIAEPVTMRHTAGASGALSDGFRFLRIDPECALSAETGGKLARLLSVLGILDFASLLAHRLSPLVRCIAGPVSFRRAYFYLYREGDYISVHDDRQVGDRVDVQFPVTLGAEAGIRILADGFLEMRYDEVGSMNVLGPCTWHDVPPLLRSASGVDPVRFNMGFRFTPAGD